MTLPKPLSSNLFYLTSKLSSDKLLWKAHRTVSGKRLEFYYRPLSTDYLIIKQIFENNDYKIVPEHKDKVLDIGAHIGLFSLKCFAYTDNIIAFEPDPRNERIFRLNQSLNKNCNFPILPFAITGTPFDKVLMKFYNNSGYNSHIPYFDDIPDISVNNQNINDYLPVDFIKMDIEGCEYQVIEQLDLSKVNKALTIEIHSHVENWDTQFNNMIKKLVDNKFIVEWFKKGNNSGQVIAKRQ